VAHASIDFRDHEYERPFTQAVADRAQETQLRCQQRFMDGVTHAVRRHAADHERPLAVAYCHFGSVGSASLAGILRVLRDQGVELCSLEEGLGGAYFAAFDQDFTSTGLVTRMDRTFSRRLGRKLRKVSMRLGLFDQRRLGPLNDRWR
jgi:hypothetical protein